MFIVIGWFLFFTKILKCGSLVLSRCRSLIIQFSDSFYTVVNIYFHFNYPRLANCPQNRLWVSSKINSIAILNSFNEIILFGDLN